MERFQSARRELQAADSRPQVGQAIQQLLDSLLPSEVSTLPERARESLSAEPAEIPGCAFDLTRCEIDYLGTPEIATMLREMAHVFVLASNRLGAIEARERLREVPPA